MPLNPYQMIAGAYTDGLTYVVDPANIGGTTPSIDDLVNTVYAYIATLDCFESESISMCLEAEIKAVSYNAFNSFVDGQIGKYNGAQRRLINMMIGQSFTSGLTIDTLKDRILDIENNITKAGLSVEQQKPLFLATMIGKTFSDYLATVIVTPGNWAPYFSAAVVGPIENSSFWLAAAMEGALIGAATSGGCGCKSGMLSEGSSSQMIQTLVAALTITVGKVIFKWIPKIQPPAQVRMMPMNPPKGGTGNPPPSEPVCNWDYFCSAVNGEEVCHNYLTCCENRKGGSCWLAQID